MEGLPSSANLNAGVEANGQPARRKRQRKTHATKSMAEPMTWLTPWTTTLGMTQYESKEQRLHDEIVAYVSYITPTTQEHHARKEVVARVEDVVKRRFSDATVTTFGSMAHDLYFPDGDIDLVICVPREVEHSNKKKMLFQLSAALKDSLMTQKVHVIHQARVPILSFETIPDLGSLKMDMSINASDGVQAIPIIVDYLHKMPALRHLVYVVKGFLLREQLNSASNGGMSSYALICLVISFLQVNPKNRPAEFIQKPLESESLGILLMDFFDYYAETFPYDTSYISVREGKILPKEDKGWENEAQRDRLSIECLVNPDHDVGRSTGKIARIRSAFRDAHSKLQNLPFTIDCANALGTILGVTEQVHTTIAFFRLMAGA
ncbi:Nucleotidyltransferase [Amylocystis lapponica]|nr:Nucleotidyltransferase [Amylocystis lapponica]